MILEREGGMGAREKVTLFPTLSHSRQTMSLGFQMIFLYSLMLYFPLSLKTTYSYLAFLELCSPHWPEGSISLNVFHRHLLFVSNLDLRTIGYRVSSSQLSGISWLMLAYPQSFNFLQFTLILVGQGIMKK